MVTDADWQRLDELDAQTFEGRLAQRNAEWERETAALPPVSRGDTTSGPGLFKILRLLIEG